MTHCAHCGRRVFNWARTSRFQEAGEFVRDDYVHWRCVDAYLDNDPAFMHRVLVGVMSAVSSNVGRRAATGWTPPRWPTCTGFLASLTEPDRCVECWLTRSEHAPSSVGRAGSVGPEPGPQHFIDHMRGR